MLPLINDNSLHLGRSFLCCLFFRDFLDGGLVLILGLGGLFCGWSGFSCLGRWGVLDGILVGNFLRALSEEIDGECRRVRRVLVTNSK